MRGDRKRPARRIAATGRAKNHLPPLQRTGSGDPVQELLARLESIKRIGQDRWQTFCPVYEDPPRGHKPSLSIVRSEYGRALVKCQAGCATAGALPRLWQGVNYNHSLSSRTDEQTPPTAPSGRKDLR